MQVIYDNQNQQHIPPFEVFNGEQTPHQEVPARFLTILKAVQQSQQHDLIEVKDQVSHQILAKIHDQNYLQFMAETKPDRNQDPWLVPSVFAFGEYHSQLTHRVAKLGHYVFDTYTPITQQSYLAAVGSASCAYQAALATLTDTQPRYALCRPPGHHANYSSAGGYCYLNNAAVAAEVLLEKGNVAILDVDFHHGNGTQDIFYQRSDVFTASIHANPNWKFPFFSGTTAERGRGEGEGFNLNMPLEAGTTNEQFQSALNQALTAITDFRPQALVVSFGADTHEADPIGGFKLTTEYFGEMARSINQLKLPTVIVQEGGYNTSLLGKNIVSFLSGFNN